MTIKKITFVKKIFADGSPCKKCGEVMEKMEAANQMRFINAVVIADEANPESEGMLLAKQYDISKAPFFLVEKDDGQIDIYTIYFKLVKDVLNHL